MAQNCKQHESGSFIIGFQLDNVCDKFLCATHKGTDKGAKRKLPYINNTIGYQRIKGGEEYLFFKQGVNEEHADGYTLTTTGESPEFDTLYLLFSREPIYMAGNNVSVNDVGMRSISHNGFIKWLVTTRKNPSVNVIERTITIKSNRK